MPFNNVLECCAIADINYKFEMNSREIMKNYLQQPEDHTKTTQLERLTNRKTKDAQPKKEFYHVK